MAATALPMAVSKSIAPQQAESSGPKSFLELWMLPTKPSTSTPTWFNKNKSYVKYSVQIYNATDKRVLASSLEATLNPKDETTEKTVKLEYKTTAEDKGDTLELRWLQLSTDSTARDLYVDNVKVEIK